MRGWRPPFALGIRLDVAGVEHPVLGLAEVHEGRLHARQHVAHLAQVDVPGQRPAVGAGHVVLHEQGPFEHHDLGLMRGAPDEHLLALGLRDRDHRLQVAGGAAVRPLPARRPRPLGRGAFGLRLRRRRYLADAADLDGAAPDAAHRLLFDGLVAHSLADDLGAIPAQETHG